MLGDSLYLDNIEEYVQDGNNVVTYKWLSRTLEVPVNVAKQMLYSYVSRCQKNLDHQISVTYIVTGISEATKDHQVQLVEDEDLEDTKKQFSSLFGVHVYSVQKHKLKDSSTLYMADYAITEEHFEEYSRWSTIECTVDVKRTGKKVTAQTGDANPPLPDLSHVQSNKDAEPKQGTGLKDVPSRKVDSGPAKQAVKSQGSSKPKKGSMKSFFGKDSGKKKDVKVKSEATSINSQPKIKSEAPSPPIQETMNSSPLKDTNKSPVKSVAAVKEEPTEIAGKQSKASGLFQGLNDSDIDVDGESEEERPPKQEQPRKKTTKKNTKKNERAKQEKAEAQQQHKRKRVQELSSDEDTPDGETRASTKNTTSKESNVKRRKKVKRLVPKMYMNESGEMVTERSWEMVSTDASDEDESGVTVDKKRAKMEDDQKLNTDKVSPKKTKQATLMNFFKK